MLRSTKAVVALSTSALALSLLTLGYYITDTVTGKATTLGDNLKVLGFCPTGTELVTPGPVATPGPVGSTGPAGETGATGEAGPAGSPGPSGAAGADGADGQDGTDGAQGPQGEQGIQGEPGATGATGPAGEPGLAGAAGTDAICTPAIDLTAITGDLIPSVDNAYQLGTSQFRWKGLQLGPGTLYIQDQTTGLQAGLTVNNGTLLIDGADTLRIGNIRLTSTGLRSMLADQDITIGATGDTGYLSVANGIKFADGTIITSAPSGGVAGPQGPAGPTGATGATGAQGAQGAQGIPGSPGTALQLASQAPGSTLDLSKQLFVFDQGTWMLPDGKEGQIVYLAMTTGGDGRNINVNVTHLRILDHGVGTIRNLAVWAPFTSQGGINLASSVSAIFLNGAWSVSGGELR